MKNAHCIQKVSYTDHARMTTCLMYVLGFALIALLGLSYGIIHISNKLSLPWSALAMIAGIAFLHVGVGILGYLVLARKISKILWSISYFLADRIYLYRGLSRLYLSDDDDDLFWISSEIQHNPEFFTWLSDVIAQREDDIVLWSDVYLWKQHSDREQKKGARILSETFGRLS